MASADPFGWVGVTIEGKFRVDEVVGEGGFGVVYRGHHLGFDEPVAIKCLKLPSSMKGAERDRFQKTFIEEGRLLHRLSRATAGIVQALDVGAATSPEGAWTPYLVLEWLRGVTLEVDLAARKERGEGGRPLAEAIALLEPAARALDAAHAQGVAHRDVKPANLFLAEIGDRRTLKVLDFGIAKVLSEVSSMTQALAETGSSVRAFTPQYGAPEQFHRKYGATGPWTDVFALALVLVEVASGKMALDGGDTTQLFIVSSDTTHRPTLRGAGVDVPAAVDEVVKKALAVDPRHRYKTAGELWDALVAALPEDVAAERRSAGDRAAAKPAGPVKLSAELASMATVDFLSAADAAEPGAAASAAARAASLEATAPTERAAGTGGGPPAAGSAVPDPAPVRRDADEPAVAAPAARAATTTSAVVAPAAEPTAPLAPVPAAPAKRSAVVPLLVVAVAAAGVGAWAMFGRAAPPPPPAASPRASAAPPPRASAPAAPSEMVRVPAGKLMMGSDSGGKTERPAHQVTLTRPFDLDRTEVTVADYAKCVAAGKCTKSGVHGPSTDEAEIARLGPMCTAADPVKSRHPITCVDQTQAEAYCRFAGKRLPTEAEWEYAARGTDGRQYPWGNEPPGCDRAAISHGPSEKCASPRGTVEVGTIAANASPFGALDMAGNAWEWVADGWDPAVYLKGWQTDPLVPSSDKGVMRGGGWDFAGSTAKTTFRHAFERTAGNVSTGFRCARTADP